MHLFSKPLRSDFEGAFLLRCFVLSLFLEESFVVLKRSSRDESPYESATPA